MKLFYVYDAVDVDAPTVGVFDNYESAQFVLDHIGLIVEEPAIMECDSESYVDYNYINEAMNEPESGVYYFVANIADNCVEDCSFNTMEIAKDYCLDNEIEEYVIRGLRVNSVVDENGVLDENGEMMTYDEVDMNFYNLISKMKDNGIKFEVTKGYYESHYGKMSF